jgi:hypothetical protein
MRGWRAVLGCGLVPILLVLAGCGSDANRTSESLTTSTVSDQVTASHGTGANLANPVLSAQVLQNVRRLRVFFAHRSVGAHLVIDGVPTVFRKYGVDPPTVNDGVPLPGGSLGDRWLDQTDNPKSKLDDFEAWIRDKGAGKGSDVAFMKLGFVDVNQDTDVPALFAQYRTMMAGLQQDFPEVTFLHVTISVTRWAPEDNAAYERFNQLMRVEYGASGKLFDIARVFSTRPDGTRTQGRTEAGETYYQMYEGYTQDGGHPNAAGAEVAATEMLRVIAASAATRSKGSG